jgi:hypothetical protein
LDAATQAWLALHVWHVPAQSLLTQQAEESMQDVAPPDVHGLWPVGQEPGASGTMTGTSAGRSAGRSAGASIGTMAGRSASLVSAGASDPRSGMMPTSGSKTSTTPVVSIPGDGPSPAPTSIPGEVLATSSLVVVPAPSAAPVSERTTRSGVPASAGWDPSTSAFFRSRQLVTPRRTKMVATRTILRLIDPALL